MRMNSLSAVSAERRRTPFRNFVFVFGTHVLCGTSLIGSGLLGEKMMDGAHSVLKGTQRKPTSS
jgi:hypothetical protein